MFYGKEKSRASFYYLWIKLTYKGPFMAFEDAMGKLKGMANDLAGKGQNWVQDEMNKVEGLAREKTDDAKQQLIAMAQKHGVDVRQDMDINEIKNKIKTALRNKTQ
jgi:hypothetical protein